MGGYLNPGSHGFEPVRADEYVDKSGLIAQVNATLGTQYKLGCTSRARRFGKSFAAKMLCAYYSRTCDAAHLFDDLEISRDPSYRTHLNKYDVIYVDVTRIIGDAGGIERVVPEIVRRVRADVLEAYSTITRRDTLTDVLSNAVELTGTKFFFIIDEWDALFREGISAAIGRRPTPTSRCACTSTVISMGCSRRFSTCWVAVGSRSISSRSRTT